MSVPTAALRLALAAAALLAPQAAAGDEAAGREISVQVEPLQGPARTGALEFVAGGRLFSPDPDFHGFSGLQVSREGRLVAVNDRGFLFEAKVRRRDGGDFIVEDARLHPFPPDPHDARTFVLSRASAPRGCVAALPRAHADRYDAEAVADLGEGLYAVAFERYHRIQCYRRLDALGAPRLAAEACPEPLRRADAELALAASGRVRKVEGNCGIEALASDPLSGVALMLSELPRRDHFAAWILRGDEAPYPLRYALTPVDEATLARDFRRLVSGGPPPSKPVIDEYRPSAAALLGEDLLVLEGYPVALGGPYAVRLMRISGARSEGAALGGECLADFAGLPPADYEGLAVVPEDDGAAQVWLISDDGGARRGGTVLLQFRLPPGSGGGGACAD